MFIALDYDGTITADPELWAQFVSCARSRGHQIAIVTMRHPHEPIEGFGGLDVIYTGRKAKASFMADLGRNPDIWIDDRPGWIFTDSF